VGTASSVITRDGRAVVCWPSDFLDSPRPVQCTTASPSGRFRRPQTLAAPRGTSITGLEEGGDGRVVVALARPDRSERLELSWATMGLNGTFGATRPLGTPLGAVSGAQLVKGPAGELLAGWDATAATEDRPGRFALQTLRRGAENFDAPVDPGAGIPMLRNVSMLYGGQGVAATAYTFRSTRHGDLEGPPVAVLRDGKDGGFGPARRVFGDDGPVVFDPEGRATVVALRYRDSETDCSNRDFGQIGATFLGRATDSGEGAEQIISDPRQIADDVTAATLPGGGTLAVWSQYDGSGGLRLEYAVRPRGGMFGRGVPLPGDVGRPITTPEVTSIASGGRHTAVTWVRRRGLNGPERLLLATVRTRPPFAARGKRPKRPRPPCQ